MNRWMIGVLIVLMLMALGAALWLPSRDADARLASLLPAVVPQMRREPLKRPYGMAPVAFEAFIRACQKAHVSPHRLTQTVGEDALSHGYHHRDGVWHGLDYCAATDIHVWGLDDAQVSRLNMALFSQGFAAWYRHGGKWTGHEHIHAVYAFLPMKPQLQGQLREFFQARRHMGFKPLKWERKWKRQRRHLRFST